MERTSDSAPSIHFTLAEPVAVRIPPELAAIQARTSTPEKAAGGVCGDVPGENWTQPWPTVVTPKYDAEGYLIQIDVTMDPASCDYST